MVQITPKARYFIEAGLRHLQEEDRLRAWQAWVQAHTASRPGVFPELTADVAPVALLALKSLISWLEEEIRAEKRDEDMLADMDNDLCFVEAVEEIFREIGHTPARASPASVELSSVFRASNAK